MMFIFLISWIIHIDMKFIMAVNGAGSGKSHFITQKLIIKACKEKRKVLVVRKVMAT